VRRTLHLVTIVAVVCTTILVAAPPLGAATSKTPLRGTNWVLSGRVSIGTPLAGVDVNAVFGAQRVDGSSGCNGYSRSYTTNGSRMKINDDGVSTFIACEGPAGKVEPKYLAALDRVGQWRIQGATLTLSTAGGRRLLVYNASGGERALRGRWDVTNFYTGSAVSSPAAGSSLALDFVHTRVSGNGGCNTFRGPYTLGRGDGIRLGPLAATQRACADPALDAQEQQYLAALDLARTYRVTGHTLTLYREDDTIAVTAQR
jgi:heat shock protein HslJ